METTLRTILGGLLLPPNLNLVLSLTLTFEVLI
jgi:hypothetical protein